MRSCQYIDAELLEEYSDRKSLGVLSFLVDVENKIIYVVPKDLEHMALAAKLLGLRAKDLKNDPQQAAYLVPSNLEFKSGEIKGIVTGISGLELGLKVKHTEKQLEKAHLLIKNMIQFSQQLGTVRVAESVFEKIRW